MEYTGISCGRPRWCPLPPLIATTARSEMPDADVGRSGGGGCELQVHLRSPRLLCFASNADRVQFWGFLNMTHNAP